MIIVYGDKKVDGAVYANPLYFSTVNRLATSVYTNDNTIKEAYEAVGVKVSTISTKKGK